MACSGFKPFVFSWTSETENCNAATYQKGYRMAMVPSQSCSQTGQKHFPSFRVCFCWSNIKKVRCLLNVIDFHLPKAGKFEFGQSLDLDFSGCFRCTWRFDKPKSPKISQNSPDVNLNVFSKCHDGFPVWISHVCHQHLTLLELAHLVDAGQNVHLNLSRSGRRKITELLMAIKNNALPKVVYK